MGVGHAIRPIAGLRAVSDEGGVLVATPQVTGRGLLCLPITSGSSTFLGSYRIAVGIHLAGCSWFQIAENTIAKIHFTGWRGMPLGISGTFPSGT